jgi:ketosteroid isomerase-like protein
MREQNIALIKAIYEAFGRGEIAFILDQLADDVDWRFEGPSSIPYTGAWHKREDVQQFFAGIGAGEKDHKLSITEFYADGDTVFTMGRYAATSAATGLRFDAPIAHFFRVENGKITRYVDFGDTAAMAAAHAGAPAHA